MKEEREAAEGKGMAFPSTAKCIALKAMSQNTHAIWPSIELRKWDMMRQR